MTNPPWVLAPREPTETRGLFVYALTRGYPETNNRPFSEAIAAFAADLRALLKAVGQ